MEMRHQAAPEAGILIGTETIGGVHSQCLGWVDAVEKVRRILLVRNNRIIGVDCLNRTCAFDAHFESILLRDPPHFFSTASVKMSHSHELRTFAFGR
jgi:hypothetical protein